MKANKDKGTSVGFLNDTILQKFGIDTEISCGVKGIPTDFKIEENLSVINKQGWEDIFESFEKREEYSDPFNFYDYYQFKKFLKENFVAPEKK